MLKKLVAMWRCLLNGRYTRKAATRMMCAHHSAAKTASLTSGPSDREADRQRVGHERARDVAVRGDLEGLRQQLGATTPPIIARMISPARLSVSRRGLVTSRRNERIAERHEDDTATAFCMADTSVHSSPSSGHEMTAWTSPPRTTLAVPIVSRTKPQKIPKCISPARGSLNIRVWISA